MPPAVLIVASTRAHVDTQEILRIQDTVNAILDQGGAVDVLIPRMSPLLSAALASSARVFTIPQIPGCANPPPRPSLRRLLTGMLMFFHGYALVSRRSYTLTHGINDGALIVRTIERTSLRSRPYIAEFHHPSSSPSFFKGVRRAFACMLENDAFRNADAVIVPDAETLALFDRKLSRARVSIIPDPHVEITPDAFTFGEFTTAISQVYAYVLRPRPEKE